MIQWVWEAARRVERFTTLIVAADSPAIAEAVSRFWGTAVLTGDCATGSDRVAEVARNHAGEIVVNLQGDEPLLEPTAIDSLIHRLEIEPVLDLTTLAVWRPGEGIDDPNVVKVLFDAKGEAVNFSRRPLASAQGKVFFKHIGIYAYRRESLLKFCSLPVGRLEAMERLEQLRALENGMKIGVVVTDRDTVSVDVPDDIARVEDVLRQGMTR